MKKLLELLGIILLTGNAIGPLVANKPNNKAKIKNSLETLNRQKRQAPSTNEQQPLPPSTAGQRKKLSTIFKEKDLGVLPDDSEETILNRIKKLNPDVNADINQVTIEKQNNSNNSIYIKYLSTDIYFGKVLCTFIPADFISEELILDGSYADNIQNMLKEFVKNNQINPLRMINNEGILRTDYFDTPDKIKERADNLKIIEKLEEILQLSKFDANKIRILVLTLKIKIVIIN